MLPERRLDMYQDDEVREIAYRIWEEEGRPSGRDLDHWLKAEVIWNERQEFAEHVAKDVEGCANCA
jgi:hypothetical protein